MVGQTLSHYRVTEYIGSGGMGEVYRATDSRLGRDVALKVLPQSFATNAERMARFSREAQVLAALNHPNISHIYGLEESDTTHALVMELVEGPTLAERIAQGPIPLEETLCAAKQIAEALEYAHERGIIHRDLKPANVKVTPEGKVKILDFGLAKALEDTPATVNINTSPTISMASTQAGIILGTAAYMSPEQARGKPVDRRADIWAFGVVLYEMLSGKQAFEGEDISHTMAAVIMKDPDWTKLPADLPASIRNLVTRCLTKDPSLRLQAIGEARIAIDRALSGAKEEAATASGAVVAQQAAWRRALPWGIAGVLALAAAMGAYLSLAPRPTSVLRSSILPPPGTSFVTMTPASGPPVLSPDGTRLAFTARDDKGKVLLYVRALTSLTAQPLAGTEGAMYPFWAPDNRQIGFFIPGKLMKIDANGGPPQTICEASNGRGGAWSKQGVIVFNPHAISPLLRVSESGGVPEPASKLDATESDHRLPQFLPDGKHFLFWARASGGPQDHTLYVGLLGSLHAKAILKGTTMAAYASGYLLFMRDTKLLAQPFDLRRLEVTGEPVSVAEGVTLNDLSGRPVFSASENGTLVYQSSSTPATWNLLWFSREGKQVGSIPQQGAPYFYPSVSPDSNRLVVSFASNLGIAGVWIFDLQRGTRTRLTFEKGIQHSPLWAPDGKAVFYGSNSGGVNHIYAKAADGSGPERTILASEDASEVPSSFSPDGRYLVYSRRTLTGTQTSHLWILPLFGDGKPFPIAQTSFDDINAAVAPNGKWMAYQSNESGRMEIYITPFPSGGAKSEVSTSGGICAHWRRDGKELFFLDGANNVMAVDVDSSGSTVRLGVPHALFSAVGARRGSGPFDVTADGRKFLINSGDVKESNEPMTLVLNWPAELKK